MKTMTSTLTAADVTKNWTERLAAEAEGITEANARLQEQGITEALTRDYRSAPPLAQSNSSSVINEGRLIAAYVVKVENIADEIAAADDQQLVDKYWPSVTMGPAGLAAFAMMALVYNACLVPDEDDGSPVVSPEQLSKLAETADEREWLDRVVEAVAKLNGPLGDEQLCLILAELERGQTHRTDENTRRPEILAHHAKLADIIDSVQGSPSYVAPVLQRAARARGQMYWIMGGLMGGLPGLYSMRREATEEEFKAAGATDAQWDAFVKADEAAAAQEDVTNILDVMDEVVNVMNGGDGEDGEDGGDGEDGDHGTMVVELS